MHMSVMDWVFRLMLLLSVFVSILTVGSVVETSRILNVYEVQSVEQQDGHTIRTALPKRALKIANGNSIRRESNRFPYSVLLVFRDVVGGGTRLHVCAGVLIRPQWALTAGSCVQRVRHAKDMFVGVGNGAPRPGELIDNEKFRLVEDYRLFPDFTDPTSGSDLALLYLKRPMNNTLPMLPESGGMVGAGQRLVGLGWGVTDVNSNFADKLQVADRFRFTNQMTCEGSWQQTNNVSATIDNRVICVFPERSNDGAAMSICSGDEGGPLLVLDTDSFDAASVFSASLGDPGRDRLQGIASFGPSECGDEKFSVYTNIAEYLDWINTTIETYVPKNKNGGGSADSAEDSIKDILVLVVLPVVAGACVFIFLAWLVLRRPGIRKSNSSIGVSSATGLKNADELERRQQQIAMMNLSPFMTPTALDPVPIGDEIGEISSSPCALPMNIKVTLVGRKLGSGAFGRVEEGVYVDEGGVHHKVAVKTVNFGEAESKDSLLNEIRIFERVGHHPNIVRCFGGRLHDSVDDESGYYIIEELMATDLGKFFKDKKQRKRTTLRDYLEIFYETANGIEHLHNREVIHFDLKPGNILLDEKQHPKLADFGCSRKRAHSYITAGARGTVAYMAPELWLLGMYARRAQVRAEKIDVFSFGVVMWESLTNQNPIDPMSMQELFTSDSAAEESQENTTRQYTGRGTNEDFRTDRFPFDASPCPDALKALIWDCVSYYNNMRPSFQDVKQRISEMLQMDWVQQHIDQVR